MKIIFMGTPDFAVPTLQKLCDSKDHQLVAVFTAKPKPKGRRMQLAKSPVHQLAIDNGIKTHTPDTIKNIEQLELIKDIEADIIVVVAYGLIIPQNILDAKKYGCLNIHPSKLPKYRGAAPIQRAIINGDDATAVCIMQMDAGLDTGDILMQQDVTIISRMTAMQLHDQCAKIGADLLLKTLNNIDNLPKVPQDKNTPCTYAHKLTKEEGKVDWNYSAYKIDCMVRGMNPWPGVYFPHNNKVLQIIEANYSDVQHEYAPGTIINNNFDVACGSGILHIKSVKPSGKKEMLAVDYLRGLAKG